MTEKDNKGNHLIRVDRRNPVKAESKSPAFEAMDLATARIVLNTIVSIHENTFTQDSDLSKAGEYSTEQIREALKITALDLLTSHERVDEARGASWIEKETPLGMLRLFIHHQIDTNLNKGLPENLAMVLDDWGRPLLDCQVPLMLSDSPTRREDSVGFSDTRTKRTYLTMYGMKDEFTLDKFRLMWKGTRWIAANMLNWDSTLKLPEELDSPTPILSNTTAISPKLDPKLLK